MEALAPAGDPSRLLPAIKDGRSAYFVQQNLGKQSLDLNHGASDEVVKDLVAKVDVVVENYGPGVMEKHAGHPARRSAGLPAAVQYRSRPLKRVFKIDIVTGADCGCAVKVIASFEDLVVVKPILEPRARGAEPVTHGFRPVARSQPPVPGLQKPD